MKRFIVLLGIAMIVAGAWASKSKPVCGETTDSKTFQLISPTNPPRECRYHIEATSRQVCQLRLDFSMVLAQPSLPGESDVDYVECVNDYLLIEGLKLCGVEEKQHIYVPFNRSGGVTEIDLDVILAARTGGKNLPTPEWNIQVIQLECPSGSALRNFNEDELNLEVEPIEPVDGVEDVEAIEPVKDEGVEEVETIEPVEGVEDVETIEPVEGVESPKSAESGEKVEAMSRTRKIRPHARSSNDGFYIAPAGCLQYFPETEGVIKSFNYNKGYGIYPGQMNYAICFRRTSNTRALEVTSYYFNLGIESRNSKVLQVDNQCYPQLRINGVSEDYLMVPQAIIEDTDVRATYFCGDSLQDATIRSTVPGPLMMVFNSDGVVKDKEAGFAFTYKIQEE